MQKPPFEVPCSADDAAEDLTTDLAQADGHGDSITDVEQRAGELAAAAHAPPISWTAARYLVTEQGRSELLASSHICYDGRALDEEG